jgi:cobalt-zinc-cadmium efflux system protein
VLIALVAGRLATRPASRFQTYGLLRAEIAGALINGFFLLGMALLVFGMGFMRLREPIHLPTTPMLIVAAGGLVTELVSISLLYRGQKTNLNVRGAYWHVLQTFGGSLIIIVAALVIKFTGFLQIDPLLGMAFGLLLFWASWSIIREAFHILLDNVPKDLDLEQVREAVERVPGVEGIHHMHAWSLTSGKNILSAHVLVSDYQQGEQTLQQIQELLKSKFQIYFSTVQIETTICSSEEEAAAIDYMRA